MDMRLGFVAILWNEPRRAAFEACLQTEGQGGISSVAFGWPCETTIEVTDLFDNAKLAIVFHLAKSDIVVKYAHPCGQSVRWVFGHERVVCRGLRIYLSRRIEPRCMRARIGIVEALSSIPW